MCLIIKSCALVMVIVAVICTAVVICGVRNLVLWVLTKGIKDA